MHKRSLRGWEGIEKTDWITARVGCHSERPTSGPEEEKQRGEG